jgi:hypothetical protein
VKYPMPSPGTLMTGSKYRPITLNALPEFDVRENRAPICCIGIYANPACLKVDAISPVHIGGLLCGRLSGRGALKHRNEHLAVFICCSAVRSKAEACFGRIVPSGLWIELPQELAGDRIDCIDCSIAAGEK